MQHIILRAAIHTIWFEYGAGELGTMVLEPANNIRIPFTQIIATSGIIVNSKESEQMQFSVLIRVLDPARFHGLHAGSGRRFRYGGLEQGEVAPGLHEGFEHAEDCVAAEVVDWLHRGHVPISAAVLSLVFSFPLEDDLNFGGPFLRVAPAAVRF